jgi:hypothetical protein
VKVLLLYLGGVFLLSARAGSRGRLVRTWPLLAMAILVSAAYYTRRVL